MHQILAANQWVWSIAAENALPTMHKQGNGNRIESSPLHRIPRISVKIKRFSWQHRDIIMGSDFESKTEQKARFTNRSTRNDTWLPFQYLSSKQGRMVWPLVPHQHPFMAATLCVCWETRALLILFVNFVSDNMVPSSALFFLFYRTTVPHTRSSPSAIAIKAATLYRWHSLDFHMCDFSPWKMKHAKTAEREQSIARNLSTFLDVSRSMRMFSRVTSKLEIFSSATLPLARVYFAIWPIAQSDYGQRMNISLRFGANFFDSASVCAPKKEVQLNKTSEILN